MTKLMQLVANALSALADGHVSAHEVANLLRMVVRLISEEGSSLCLMETSNETRVYFNTAPDAESGASQQPIDVVSLPLARKEESLSVQGLNRPSAVEPLHG